MSRFAADQQEHCSLALYQHGLRGVAVASAGRRAKVTWAAWPCILYDDAALDDGRPRVAVVVDPVALHVVVAVHKAIRASNCQRLPSDFARFSFRHSLQQPALGGLALRRALGLSACLAQRPAYARAYKVLVRHYQR